MSCASSCSWSQFGGGTRRELGRGVPRDRPARARECAGDHAGVTTQQEDPIDAGHAITMDLDVPRDPPASARAREKGGQLPPAARVMVAGVFAVVVVAHPYRDGGRGARLALPGEARSDQQRHCRWQSPAGGIRPKDHRLHDVALHVRGAVRTSVQVDCPAAVGGVQPEHLCAAAVVRRGARGVARVLPVAIERVEFALVPLDVHHLRPSAVLPVCVCVASSVALHPPEVGAAVPRRGPARCGGGGGGLADALARGLVDAAGLRDALLVLAGVAVGETFIPLHPPLPSAGVSVG